MSFKTKTKNELIIHYVLTASRAAGSVVGHFELNLALNLSNRSKNYLISICQDQQGSK